MNKMKYLSFAMALLLILTLLAGCAEDDPQDDGPGNNTVVFQDIDDADIISRTDHRSVYSVIGSRVTIDMVEENADGLAFVTVDGVRYELGMDFLSMAMVYNTSVPEGSTEYETPEDVYNEWWKLYIQRWNYLDRKSTPDPALLQ